MRTILCKGLLYIKAELRQLGVLVDRRLVQRLFSVGRFSIVSRRFHQFVIEMV